MNSPRSSSEAKPVLTPKHKFFRAAITVNDPLQRQSKAQPYYYHLENLTSPGSIRIETNFKMRK